MRDALFIKFFICIIPFLIKLAWLFILNSNVNDLKKSVSDGKTLVANAITDKGVATATDATFETMANNIGIIDTNPERTLLWTNDSPSPWQAGAVGGFVTLPTGSNIAQYPYIAIESFMNTYTSTDPSYTDMQIFETAPGRAHSLTASKANPWGLGDAGPRTFIVNYTAADKIYFYNLSEGGGYVAVPYRIWGIKNLNFKTI